MTDRAEEVARKIVPRWSFGVSKPWGELLEREIQEVASMIREEFADIIDEWSKAQDKRIEMSELLGAAHEESDRLSTKMADLQDIVDSHNLVVDHYKALLAVAEKALQEIRDESVSAVAEHIADQALASIRERKE